MATDPICGMFVEESPDALHATVRGTTYYFCSESCLKEFTHPEIELRNLKFSVVLALILGIPILILSYVLPVGLLLLALATPVQFIAGWRFYKGTYNAIKMRSSNMDVLIAIGTSAAYFYSLIYVLLPKQFPYGGLYFDSSAIVIALILFGRLLEYSVRGKATEAIRKLVELQPRTATVVRSDGREEEVQIEQVQAGVIFVVKPGERIATEGTVVDGLSSVDEKMVTGESIPVEKTSDSQVIGATINDQGFLKVRATKVGADTTLSKIVQVVQQAQSSKGPVERLVDTISKYFVPMVVSVALFAFAAWTLVAHESVSFGFTTAVAVLVIACPCALGLATPAAIVVGAGKGAENGILIKGGEYLERTQKIDTIVFDKIGTLTKGKPSVTDVVPFNVSTYDEDEIIKFAALTEKRSEHPLASAIIRKAESKLNDKIIPDPEMFEAISGKGVHATYSGHDVIFGNPRILGAFGLQMKEEDQRQLSWLQSEGKTVMVLAVDKVIVGLVAVADTLKEHAEEAVRGLHKMGLQVIILTGDNQATTAAIAKQVGIDKYFADEKKTALKSEHEGQIFYFCSAGCKKKFDSDPHKYGHPKH